MWGHFRFARMKHQTGLCSTGTFWTGPCRAKPNPASPNHVRSAFFWDITQCRVVIPHQHFVTTYWSQFQRSRNPKERNEHNRKLIYNFIFFGGRGDFVHCQFLEDAQHFRSQLYSLFQAKMHVTWRTLYTVLFSITGQCRNINLLRYVCENRSSSIVVKRKIPIEKLLINYKTQKYNLNQSTN